MSRLDTCLCAMLFVRGVGQDVRLIPRVGAVLALGMALAACRADRAGCVGSGCAWSSTAWARLQSLSWAPIEMDAGAPVTPPPDPSNLFSDSPEAAALGKLFYFDPRFSGNTALTDAIGRTVVSARTPLGTPANISCASCHDPTHAGTDITSMPNTVSIGAGIYDVNGQQTLNAAFFPLLYWNGRSDSLWAQALAVNESKFSMNGTRLQTFWTIVDYYLPQYTAVFGNPLPTRITEAEFPLRGKPGTIAGCQASSTTEPFKDAFDCMQDGQNQKELVDLVFVNFGKAIEAYEHTLVSRASAFDLFVRDGPGSGWISDAAKRGAMLFVGKASCVDCHNGPLLSDTKFHNIGVPQTGDHVPTVADCPASNGECDCAPGEEGPTCAPSGAWAGALKLNAANDAGVQGDFRRDSMPWSDSKGRPEPCATTEVAVEPPCPASSAPLDPSLKGAWRTPSLRDVALTAPYMHDGYYQTLTDVVQHYNMGGVPSAATAFQRPVCGAPGGVDAAWPTCADGGASQPHLAAEIKPLDLSDDEVSDLVAFLGTLTGAPLSRDASASPDLPSASAFVDTGDASGFVLNEGGVPDAGASP
jgi:cytochrome c peroxidase